MPHFKWTKSSEFESLERHVTGLVPKDNESKRRVTDLQDVADEMETEFNHSKEAFEEENKTVGVHICSEDNIFHHVGIFRSQVTNTQNY